jgi:hypothetical protein
MNLRRATEVTRSPTVSSGTVLSRPELGDGTSHTGIEGLIFLLSFFFFKSVSNLPNYETFLRGHPRARKNVLGGAMAKNKIKFILFKK